MEDSPILRFGPFSLVMARRALLDGNKQVSLGSRAFDVLVVLASNAGHLVSPLELMEKVWPDTVVDSGNLRVHIAALRKALGEGRDGRRYIRNVPLRGYIFDAEVEQIGGAADVSVAVPMPGRSRPFPVLPAAPHLFGRDAAVNEVVAQLDKRRCLSIIGAGGMGKTVLAQAIAGRMARTLTDGVVWVELAPLTSGLQVPSAVAAALGIVVDPADPVRALGTFLRGKRMLLVLDNCEHVLDATAGLVERALKSASDFQVLATSREALRVEGEWVVRLSPLRLPAAKAILGLRQAHEFSAVGLFIERVSAVDDALSLGDADVPAICDICKRLDGIPLAIELAAAKVPILGVQGVARHLEDRLSLLTHGRRTALPRHQTLRATLDWSFALLSPIEQCTLLRLGVFRGYFSLESAVAICADASSVAHGDATDTAEAIYGLVAKSMLQVDASTEPVQYRLLETTRAYALEGLATRGEAVGIACRHAEHLSAVLARTAIQPTSGQSRYWQDDFARRLDDLRAALVHSFSADGDPNVGIALAADSASLWFALSLMAEFRVIAEQALLALERVNATASQEMRLRESYGHALWHTRGGGPEMKATFTRALELAQAAGDTSFQLRAMWGLWLILHSIGDYAGAADIAVRFGEMVGDAPPGPVALTHDRMMALAFHLHGEQETALVYAEQLLVRPVADGQAVRNGGFQFDQRVTALTVLSRILWVQGRPERALACAREAVETALTIGHTLSLCYCIATSAAPVAMWAGDFETANNYTDLLERYAAEHSLASWEICGQCYRLVLSLREVAVDLRPHRPLDAVRGPWMGSLIKETLCTIDPYFAEELILARGDRDEAGWCMPELLRIRATHLYRANQPEAAEELLSKATKVAIEQGALSWELRCAMTRAEWMYDHGQRNAARQALSTVLERFVEGENTSDLKAARTLMGRLT